MRQCLQDGLLGTQTAASLRTTLAPKLGGLVNLAACLPDCATVVFSSIAGALGSAGQVSQHQAVAFRTVQW